MYVGSSYWDDGTTLSEGDDVIVQGEVTEYYDWTEIADVDFITATGTSNASNIVPISVTTGTLGDSCNVLGEAYESVLVTLSGVGMMEAANSYGEITINDGTGPTQLEDGILNTDATFETGFCFPVSPATTWDYVGTNITTLTGVIKYSYGSYEVHPRTMDDIDYAPDGCEMSPSPTVSPVPSADPTAMPIPAPTMAPTAAPVITTIGAAPRRAYAPLASLLIAACVLFFAQ